MTYCERCKRLGICERVEKGIAHSCVGFTRKKTNADRIRTIDNIELARELAAISGYEGNPDQVEYFKWWLEQEAGE